MDNNCDKCGKMPIQHLVRLNGESIGLCCRCHVADGNPPSDWHPGCMKAWADKLDALNDQSKESG